MKPVFLPMTRASLDAVLALEGEVYPFPWTRGNFADALSNGYVAWTVADEHDAEGGMVAYCVAMDGVDETHLLNITVVPRARRRGLARTIVARLAEHGRERGATQLWLEVRPSNADARAAYARLGFAAVGTRKGYYPDHDGRREDAIVMSLNLA